MMEDWDDHRKDVRHGRVAMRHGHRKGLDVPKRGKAAIRAEIQGQGPEVLRGRSAFRRSLGRSRHGGSPEYRGKYGCMWMPVRRRRQLRSETRRDAAEVDLPWLEMEEDSDADVDAGDSAEVQESLDEREPSCCGDMSESEAESNWSFVSCAASCSTASRVADFKATKEATAWDLALLRAEAGAAIYAAYLLEHGHFRVGLPMEAKKRTPRQPRTMEIEAKLLQQFCTTVYWNSQEKTGKRQRAHGAHAKQEPFDEFRRRFLQDHGLRFCSMLQSLFRGPVCLKPTPLSKGVQDNFLLATKIFNGQLIPTYHGTATSNLGSIFQRGLLIPRENGNDIRVANGSAHGVGIYTAQVDSPQLSLGFAKGSKTLLICGVLDDAVPVNAAAALRTYGHLGLKAESESIRHVGDAVVIFDSRRVAPLFVATSWQPIPKPSKLHRKPPKHQGPRTRLRKKRDKTESLRELRLVAFLARRGAMKRRP